MIVHANRYLQVMYYIKEKHSAEILNDSLRVTQHSSSLVSLSMLMVLELKMVGRLAIRDD